MNGIQGYSGNGSDLPHLALFLPSLRGGGAERVMVTVANGLAARGFRVDLVVIELDGPYVKEVAPAIRIVDLRCKRMRYALPPLVRYLRRERPDAMLSALIDANLTAIWARMLARVKMRLVVRECNSISAGLKRGRRARMTYRLVQWFYPRAEGIICISKAMEAEMATLLRLPREKLCTIYNPLDVDLIRARATERPDHPWLAPGEPPVVLAVGRLVVQKDYPVLLRAFARLRAARHCRLVILGEGEERAPLEALARELGIADDTAMPGFQDNPFGWMAACDLYVMSSAWEGLPGALQQALVCGAKVVSTDCPVGPREILEDGKWGRLVPPGDEAALAGAMAAALDEDKLPGGGAVERFAAEGIVEEYLGVLGGSAG